ncbi:hypothetical protein E3N88_18102 [Mikania micrantha]|uniref:Disease resistance R13L4/SHOC-2-like LRR domain-containing protein n=1 Tax=Mikania micrantha TaxID=192012 RepID=A0A5N6NTX2_9ASTR|nr:hypothetical protein E3N88_18102 [Mikania micrantha]
MVHQENASSDVASFQKFDSWRKITSNSSNDYGGSDCCLWDGVVCNDADQVIGLDLSQSFIRGTIDSNSTLFNLVHLQMLNLSMNDFAKSRIPSEIGCLQNLRSLDLSSSSFSGQIPSEIVHLVHLSSLHLSWNTLKLESPSLETLVQNLTRLEELHLAGIDISSSVPSFLANLSLLRSIHLEDCQLRDEFPVTLFQLPQLKFVSMAKNPKLVGSLHAFHSNTILEHLDLGSTGFSGSIPGSLSNMTQLSHLNLGQNQLTGLVPSLENLSKLIFLDLSDNHFKNEKLPDWLSKLSKLNELRLDRMSIHDEIPLSLANLTILSIISITDNYIFDHIQTSFMNLTQLSVIDFGRNQFYGQISRSFSNFKNLQYLGLDHNNFSGRADLDTFLGLNKLETLYLSYNKISFFATNNYTNGTLPKLKNLGLSSCNLKEFPGFLRFQNKMVGLFLYENKIRGLVPKWIWNNSLETLHLIGLSNNFITGFHGYPKFLPWFHLQSFEMSYNQLQGQLPVSSSTAIVYDVSNNNLTGEIPLSMCEAKSLQVLDLSSNYMTGTIPTCLGNLSNSLLFLSLKRNNFHGPIRITFSHGSPLKRIDLSENRFTGRIQKSLAKCTKLEFLSLGDNFLEDVFPFWLGILAELRVLILRSNRLYGGIQGPMRISSQYFHKLRIIDLSNNRLNGQLPDEFFQTWNGIKSANLGKSSAMGFDIPFNQLVPFDYPYSMTITDKGVKRDFQKVLNIFTSIDLSCNNFEGKIPQSLQDLHGLESLNLSNNHLIGRILPSLQNLKNLESLDLSRNKLSGEIPQQLSLLGFLEIFNVSFNNLDGRIPQGKQFDTFDNSSYKGNPRLCGQPLSKSCQSVKTSSTTSNQSESLMPSDWMVIFLGVGSGFIIGIVIGNLLYATCLFERFMLRKDICIRPLSNTNMNQRLSNRYRN